MTILGYEGDYLSLDEIKKIHDKIIDTSGNNDPKGYIDITGALFESAVNAIFASFGGQDAYPTIEEKACRLCFNIATSHCFENANKRTAILAMLMTFSLNQIKTKRDEQLLFDLVNKISGNDIESEDERWENFRESILDNIVEKGESKSFSG